MLIEHTVSSCLSIENTISELIFPFCFRGRVEMYVDGVFLQVIATWEVGVGAAGLGAATFYVVSCVHFKLDCCKFLSKLKYVSTIWVTDYLMKLKSMKLWSMHSLLGRLSHQGIMCCSLDCINQHLIWTLVSWVCVLFMLFPLWSTAQYNLNIS